MAGPLRGGGEELNGCATRKKELFYNVRKKVPMATKPRETILEIGLLPRGGGAEGLSGRVTKKKTFFRLP